jgi:hypothetical protein
MAFSVNFKDFEKECDKNSCEGIYKDQISLISGNVATPL